jgi:hypothetical protein
MVGASAAADTGPRELQVMARAVGFVDGLPRGIIDAAVVDGPGAEAVMAAMSGGVSAGGVTLIARRIAPDRLAASGVRVIIVPEGQGALHAQIAAAARQLRAVTVSTDMSCVRSGRCVIGVAARPRVEIVVSRDAGRANEVSFAQAFRIMIREI